MHVYVPWWLYEDKQKDFPRGYHIEIGGGFGMPELGSFAGQCNRHEGYGKALKDKIREEYGAFVNFAGRGEMIPNKDSYCEIDPNKTDAWGIPVLRFHAKYSDNEFKMARHAMNTFAEVCENAGFEVLTKHDQMWPPGYSIHELGTCRMGENPKNSVLNKWNQTHDVKNLFVVDGSSFVTGGYQNPTMTILSLSMRASEYLAEQMRAGNV